MTIGLEMKVPVLIESDVAFHAGIAPAAQGDGNMRYGLLGRRLPHSLSPEVHRYLGLPGYELWEREPDETEAFFKERDFDGCNVTIPYKETAFAACDRIDDTAKRTGAVNTVVREADGTLSGYNTDYEGLRTALRGAGIDPSGKKAAVLGTGGTARTACCVLKDLGAREVVTVSRSPEGKVLLPGADVLTDHEGLYERHADAEILVNCTPVGMMPDRLGLSADIGRLPALKGVFDCIYNPLHTDLLLAAEKAGLPCGNGLLMLAAQAYCSQRHFGRGIADPDLIEETADRIRRERENVVLIGMPGSGKTTVGRAVSKILDKEFADLDEEIEKEAGEKISSLLPRIGEKAFREMESAAAERAGKRSGIVIAAGGGIVTRPENYLFLARNGRLFFLKRDFDKLERSGRPLSDTPEKLREIAKRRAAAYRAFAQYIVDNNGELSDTVQAVCEEIL